jgi:hypothetical protein
LPAENVALIREQNIKSYKHNPEAIIKLLLYKEIKTLSLRNAEDAYSSGGVGDSVRHVLTVNSRLNTGDLLLLRDTVRTSHQNYST